MRLSAKTFVPMFVAVVMMALPCAAQDVEPPFTWQGKGSGSFISQGGIEELNFDFELSVDEQGMFKGQTSSDQGPARIVHVFASDRKEYEFPGFFSRNLVIVFMLNEYGSDPLLSILNGRALMDKFLYGEVLLARYEAGSDLAKALGVGDPEATLMDGDELPYNLKSALAKCLPFGTVKITGDYKAAADTASADSDAVSLFNGQNLDGWHIWLEDAAANPAGVWKVTDGAIYCSGKPTGFLRTQKEYSDFKLVFEWRWPEEPGNSGVLLHMSDEEKVWPLCMEAQLMHNRAGDIVGMGCSFNENVARQGSPVSYTPHKNESNEKEPGGWNTYEITCNGDTMELKINGQFQNKATGVSLRRGYIGFQSEGVPIMFRNFKLTPLN